MTDVTEEGGNSPHPQRTHTYNCTRTHTHLPIHKRLRQHGDSSTLVTTSHRPTQRHLRRTASDRRATYTARDSHRPSARMSLIAEGSPPLLSREELAMKRAKYFGNRGPGYLRAADILNDDIPWQIKQCREATIGKPPVPKPVLYFHGENRGLILNATRWDALEAAFGKESDDWIGHKVHLSPESGVFRGGDKEGKSYVTIRVRAVVDAPSGGGSTPPPLATANGLDHVEVDEANEPSRDRDD